MAIYEGRILMRRGLLADLDKTKLQPGEFAVCIDTNTSDKKVFLNFGNNIVKELGTFEEFEAKFTEVYNDLLELANNLQIQEDEIVVIQSDIVNNYYPQIQQWWQETQDNRDWVENAFTINFPEFIIDIETMELQYRGGVFGWRIVDGYLEYCIG